MRRHSTALLFGWLIMLMFLFLTSLVLAIALRFTHLQNPFFNQLTTILGFLIIFISAFISGAKAKRKGWLVGALLSIGFTLIVYLYQFLGNGEHFTWQQMIYHIGFFFTSVFGAIFGVNLFGDKRTS
ncbi:TIGR04086 family membrane protein [Amphibacillus sediminis]|uniref:TIGR04086 family membrane protein n=1 Tax=Amphibacillus sediminis TaxID=360185 RepID=UPI000832E765|nr:TIGR04086 family membrane protein [Amphibacillus sediminis]